MRRLFKRSGPGQLSDMNVNQALLLYARAILPLASVLIVGGLLGCSQQRGKTVRQISAADTVMLTNSLLGSGRFISADETKRLIKVVAAGKRDRNNYPAIFDGEMKFYSGTNLLAVVRFQDRIFRCGDEQYTDESGALASLYSLLATNLPAERIPQ